MRNTYLKYGKLEKKFGKIVHRFMIGIQSQPPDVVIGLNKEQRMHQDLALMDMEEDWTNLTGKLLESMTWSITHLPDFQYLLKVDVDTYVRLDRLMEELDRIPDYDKNRVSILSASICFFRHRHRR